MVVKIAGAIGGAGSAGKVRDQTDKQQGKAPHRGFRFIFAASTPIYPLDYPSKPSVAPRARFSERGEALFGVAKIRRLHDMTDLPLMPKATAVWLVDNTTMTFRQIADFCGMHEL